MKFAKLLAITMALLLCISGLAACGGKKDGETAGTYVIGLSGPLTGGASVYGIAVKNSAQMAIDEINEAGGLDGVKFSLIALDDAHDATKVEANYAKMYEDGMHVSLGCVTSNPCLEFAALSKEDNVFFLTPSASNDKVVDADNAYQMCFADAKQGEVAAAYVNGLGLDKIGIFYKSDDSYSKGIYECFKSKLSDSIEVVEASFMGEANDFTQQVSTLKDCKFVFMPIYYDPASLFMKKANGIIADDAVFYGCDGFDGIESAEGFDITSIPQQVSMLSHFNSKATDGKAAEFIEKYTKKYGKETLNQFGASAYDCVYAIFGAMKAAKAAGKEISPEMAAEELCEILKDQFNNGFTYENGVTGEKISWSKDGFVNKVAVYYVIKEADAAPADEK